MKPNMDGNHSERNFRDSYVLSKTIGSGNFANVRKVRHKFSRSMYAAKMVKLPVNKENDDYEDILEMVRNEVNIMRRLKHSNLVQFIDVFYAKEQVVILTELTEHGDLHEFVQNSEEELSEEKGRYFCLQIASAVNYMHSLKIAHRDLKPENVLLFKGKQDTDYTLKLCDFGLAEEVRTLDGLSRVCGSPSFVAPEILEFKSYGLAVDIWSMGALFYLILCRYVPFDNVDMSRKFDMIMHNELYFPDNEWGTISKEAKQLIGWMLEKNPKKRIKARDVMYAKWFRQSGSNILFRNFPKPTINGISFKTAALAAGALFKRNRKILRDDAVLSKRLVENTFLFSKNIQEESEDVEQSLPVMFGTKLRSRSEICPNHQSPKICKLPPINKTNLGVVRASSDDNVKRTRLKDTLH